MKNKWFVSAGLVAAAVIGFAQVSALRLESRMTGSGNDKGKAKWQTRDSRGQLQAELEVEAENLVPNETYTIQVDANTPWSVQANAFGAFEFEQLYRGANRPVVGNGSSVWIFDSAGATILSGTLRGR